MAEQNSISYPMISEKNWWTIREKFKSTIPSVVSPTYIKTLLTLSSDASANSNVITPMKRIGLIDEENKPTPLANDWRLDNKYGDACGIMVNSVYPTELLDLFPDSNIDRNSARTWFMSQGVGQGAADKMVALFVMLKSGEIKEIKVTAPKKAKQATKAVDKPPRLNQTANENENKEHSISEAKDPRVSYRPNLHIDLQIHISPESSPEQIETIFASMARHLYGVDNS